MELAYTRHKLNHDHIKYNNTFNHHTEEQGLTTDEIK